MADVRSFEYKGRSFMNMINRYFMYNEGKERNLTFTEIDNRGLSVKIEKLNGREIYGFSSHFNPLANNKFVLEDDCEYHIYKDDIDSFNEMDEYHQVEYLGKMKVGTLDIGTINSKELQKVLRAYIKPNVKYIGVVKVINGGFWWTIENVDFDGMTLSINAYLLSKFSYSTSVTVELPEITNDEKEYNVTDALAKKIVSTLDKNLSNTGMFLIIDKQYDARSAEGINSIIKLIMKAKDENECNTRICTIATYPIGNLSYARIKVNDEFNDLFNEDLSINYVKGIFDGGIKDVLNRLATIGDVLSKDKNEYYRKVGNALQALKE